MNIEVLHGIVLTAIPILLSLSVHEFAHARTALAFGDPTAKAMGRCTLNPLAHLDPVGTLMIIIAGFGWAKPVPVNPMNLQPRRVGDIAVSLAGPASNFGIALLCMVVLRIVVHFGVAVDPNADFVASDLVVFLLAFTIIVNLCLCVFNLIPLFPLDGHHIGRETLPAHLRSGYMHWQVRSGRLILLVLLIGPRLLARVTSKNMIDPLGYYISFAINHPLRWMLGTEAWWETWAAMDKFSPYLIWW